MSIIENNTLILSSDIRRLQGQLDSARSHLKQLNQQMEQLNHMWKGPANAMMRQRFQQDFETITSLCGFIEQMINKLESARRAYETCEANVSDTVSAIHIP